MITKSEDMIQRGRDFTEKYIKPIAKELDENNRFPMELKDDMAAEGFLGIHYPKEYGGLGLDAYTAYATNAELAKGSAGISLLFTVHWMAVDTIIKYGSDEIKEKYLRDLVTGKKIAAYSLSEFHAGSDASAIKTTAEKVEDGWLLNGAKYFCTNGGIADIYVLTCKTDVEKGTNGISVFILEKGQDGFNIGPYNNKMGCRSSATTSLFLNNCLIPQGNIIGAENEGFKMSMYGLCGGRVGMSAMGIGIAEATLDEAATYANKRIAFGKPLSKLFSVQEMISDSYVKLQASKLLLKMVCEKIDSGKNFAFESSVAKLSAADMVNTACHNAVQIFGGHGYMKDNDVERFARDGRLMDIGVGSSEVLKMVVGSTVLNMYK